MTVSTFAHGMEKTEAPNVELDWSVTHSQLDLGTHCLVLFSTNTLCGGAVRRHNPKIHIHRQCRPDHDDSEGSVGLFTVVSAEAMVGLRTEHQY